MNPFDEIETYMTARVQEVDSVLTLREDPFGQEDISSITADKYFKLWFTDTVMGREGNAYFEEVNATLEIYARRKRDVNRSFKDVYCKGLDIKNAIINPVLAKVQDFMTDVFVQVAAPVPLDTDDNTIKVVLSILIRRDLQFNN